MREMTCVNPLYLRRVFSFSAFFVLILEKKNHGAKSTKTGSGCFHTRATADCYTSPAGKKIEKKIQKKYRFGVHNHHHLSLNREGRWGTTYDFATSFLHFPLFSTALWDLSNSRPVHSLMSSSHLFLCPPCLLPPFTVPCKMVLARPDERET